MKDYIITFQNIDTEEYFFTTNHCQPHNLGREWVPTTYGPLPASVKPRESLPTGIITNKEDYKKVFFATGVEIPNPQPEYQA